MKHLYTYQNYFPLIKVYKITSFKSLLATKSIIGF